ncbi:MAG: hypothetical protein MK078_02475 [Crocinitomicaceae bacterium]|nr:hypothetical protein [Crocinitomicaceae bacterium]
MKEERENIDLGRFRNYKKQNPKLIIRYVIYTAVLFFIVFYGIKFIEELIPKTIKEEGIEVLIEESDTLNTQQ